MKVKLVYDKGEEGYVISRRWRRKYELVLCWGFVSAYFKDRTMIPPDILVTASASRFKGARWVWIKIEHGDGIRWRRGLHSLWNPMFTAAQRWVRKLYPPGHSYTVRKLYYLLTEL